MNKNTLNRLSETQKALTKLQPLPDQVKIQLQEWFKVELTYTSNAIEGSTLTRMQTAEVIQKGIQSVIPGKSLAEQIEALQHGKAVDYVDELLAKRFHSRRNTIDEEIILEIHRIVLTGTNDLWAGRYRESEVIVAGTDYQFPKASTVPYQMAEFIDWLNESRSLHPVQLAADAHFKLVTIHPFVDGNGRTARLLMNLILGYHNYPPAIISPDMRPDYLEAVKQGQVEGNMASFYSLIAKAVERSLDKYTSVAMARHGENQANKIKVLTEQPLKIGELAKATGESVATIRYWTKEGLLTTKQDPKSVYHLYNTSMIQQVKLIRKLQTTKRLTLAEIQEWLTRGSKKNAA